MANEPQSQTCRILYVEDDEGLARLFKKKMERAGYTVELAETGEKGLELFDPKRHDAVVLDYRLPGISGLDVLKQLAPLDGEPPIILLTAGGDEELAVEALRLGAADYLVKDVAQIYFDLLPSVLEAAVTKLQLKSQNERQQDDLRYYVQQLEAEVALRKASEEKARKSEEQLQLALFGTKDGIYDWDVATGHMYFSPRWKEMLGYGIDEIEPHLTSTKALVHPDDLEETMRHVSAFLNLEIDSLNATFRQRHKDGSYRWILSRARGIKGEDGQIIRVIGAHTDVTEIKELELRLKDAYEQANEANLAKTEFLANMSHEIRTPMNAVIGLSGILSRSEPLTPKQKEFISMLQLAAESLLGLINDLLDISKIEARSVDLENIPFHPVQVIEEIVGMLQMKAKEKGLSIAMDDNGLRDLQCLGDPTRFRQVILNLCSNAVKFTDTGGVQITISKAVNKNSEGRDVFAFQVRDTGIGIPEDKLSTIFEKFIQADLSITRRFGGSGLGLAITKTLVDLMGGTVEIESKADLGSSFTVMIPFVCMSGVESGDEKKDDARKFERKLNARLLVVEDHPTNLFVVKTHLDDFGIAHDVAISGQEAIDAVMAGDYDVILMDVQMEGIDGLAATKEIRRIQRETGRKPAIIIGTTAFALTGDRDRCIAAGMDDYLSKPFSAQQLEQMLDRYLTRQ